ncbi:MAG: CAP domain-containing protein [Lachnospiraceae bacterium]|nr:CAP domain-containing protein [Lachnospiraceae bacterium]
MKKFLFCVAAIGVIGCMNISSCSGATGISVSYRSADDIKKFLKEHPVNTDNVVSYSTKPELNVNGKQGVVSNTTLNSALNALNTVRYIAGLNSNVKLNSAYTSQVQSAAFVMALNNSISHYPSKPSGLSDSIYSQAQKGASSSNISWTSWHSGLEYSIINSWMDDSDSSNASVLGHRRWILNPTMQQTGFGSVYDKSRGTFSVMYAFDGFGKATNIKGVAWPAQNMPIEYFNNSQVWSISMGEEVSASKIKVVLTRLNDNKVWKFSNSSANGYFTVNNEGYGTKGCIIFKPNNISYSAGDKFNVKITGVDSGVNYNVSFFSVADVCVHKKTTATLVKKATLKANGILEKKCADCGDIQTKIIYRIKTCKLKYKSVKYTGKLRKPKVIVKDSSGKKISKKYYKVKINKKPIKRGKYKVTVRFKGRYKGKKTLKYKIK